MLIETGTPSTRRLTVTAPCATARWLTVSPGDRFRGMRLLPGRAPALLGIATRALGSHGQPLSSVSPALERALLQPLAAAATPQQVFAAMTQALAPLAARASAGDVTVQQTVVRLTRAHGNARICDLAQEAGISERQLRRRFHAAVGLTPKQLARALRVRLACIRLVLSPSLPLAAIAHDAGYADQAHFSRELSEVFGSPARALSALLRGYEHSRFESALWTPSGQDCPIRSRRRTSSPDIKRP